MNVRWLIHVTPADGKPVILVVMHHTFHPNLFNIQSSQQVTRPDVCLTVDSLFYEGKLLTSNINNAARIQIQKWLGASTSNVITKLLGILQSFISILTMQIV